jgi:hypothetical protein
MGNEEITNGSIDAAFVSEWWVVFSEDERRARLRLLVVSSHTWAAFTGPTTYSSFCRNLVAAAANFQTERVKTCSP